MDINLTMCLPRDHSTLPLVRHLCKYALWEIGVSRDCAADVELALTEACSNVVQHSAADDEYEVHIAIRPDTCEIRVIDTGHGFDFSTLGLADADHAAESGRGIQLMRALVDTINFRSEPESGTIVHLVKRLEFDGHPLPPFVTQGRPERSHEGDGSVRP